MPVCTSTRLFVHQSCGRAPSGPCHSAPTTGEPLGTPAARGTSRFVPAGSAGTGGGGAHRFREGPSPGRVAAASGGVAGVPPTPRPRKPWREARPRAARPRVPRARVPPARPASLRRRPAPPGPGARDGTCCVLKSQPRQQGRAARSAMAAEGPAARLSVLPAAAVSPRSSARRRRARPSPRPAGLPDPCHPRACALAPPAGGRGGDAGPAGSSRFAPGQQGSYPLRSSLSPALSYPPIHPHVLPAQVWP